MLAHSILARALRSEYLVVEAHYGVAAAAVVPTLEGAFVAVVAFLKEELNPGWDVGGAMVFMVIGARIAGLWVAD
jgi:hypothetical protein